MISIGAIWKRAWRRLGAALARYFEPVPAPGPISEAIAEAIVRFPNDRVVREAGAWAELEVREILGQRRIDA